MKYLRELPFAGRIFLLDRLTGEKASSFVRRYSEMLGRYMDTDILCGILENSPGLSEEHALLKRAEELSLSESDRTAKPNRIRNLTSVFSRLSIRNEGQTEKVKYDLKPFDTDCIFPKIKNESSDAGNLGRKFYKELDALSRNAPDRYEDFIVVLDRIFLKYLWCITASDYEGEDISLYDHSKVTSAILNCLVQENVEKGNEYCLLMGDFSGIQKYIFSIASTNQSNVAKRLRARSFYVDIMIRIFAYDITKRFGLDHANVLLQTGGKFYLLLPNTKMIEEELEGIRKELDAFLYEEFHGSVSLNLAWITVSDNGLKNYSETIVQLNEKLSECKTRAFSSLLKNNNCWDEDAFVLYKDLANKHLCQGCGISLIRNSEELCPQCSQQIEIGRKLANARFIVYEKKPSKDNFHIFKDYYVRITDRADIRDGIYTEALKTYQLSDEYLHYPITQKYMTNHVPEDSCNAVQTFSEIAESAAGMHKLGVLKADVDMLGYLFADGLRKGNKHYGTISRVNTMSRMLEAFFSGYINRMIEDEHEFKNIYSVFAGGDDLFLIGPWNVMPDLAIRIQKDFNRFSGSNPSMTLSAAITLFGEKEHISFMADKSEDALSCAKDGEPDTLGLLHDGREGRNCICFMGDLFTWEDFNEQMRISKDIASLIQSKKLGTALLNRLDSYSRMYREFLVSHNIFALMYDPMLSYDMSRNYGNLKGDEDIQEFKRYVSSMQMDAADYRKPKTDLYYACTVVKCALNMTRMDRNGNE